MQIQNDTPQTKREVDYCAQRDRLEQALRKVLVRNEGLRFTSGVAAGVDTAVEAEARKVLVEIYGR